MKGLLQYTYQVTRGIAIFKEKAGETSEIFTRK